MATKAKYWINKLKLQKHPEGGWFREIYRSDDVIPKDALPAEFSGDRNISTSIYYLLEGEDRSAFHRIKSDEIWHFYTGSSSVEIWILKDKKLIKKRVGNDMETGDEFQVVVPKNTWFAAHLTNKNGYALVGCTVSPGFHFDDFEMNNEEILAEYPHLTNEIREMLNNE